MENIETSEETSLNLEEEKCAHGEPPNPFDELAALYEDLFTWPFRRDVELPNLLAVIGDVSGLSILDFGCGTGVFSRHFKNAGAARVVGFDTSIGMIRYAKEKAINSGSEIEFTSELIPEIYNGKFDIVLGVYILPYATTKAELASVCSDMAKLLKPKGRLFTLPIHPKYNQNPGYYKEYGVPLMQQKHCSEPSSYIDGGPIELHLCYGKWDVRLMATYWSEATLTHVLVKAGFSSVSHIDLCKIDLESLCPTLVNYAKQPHASLIECIK